MARSGMHERFRTGVGASALLLWLALGCVQAYPLQTFDLEDGLPSATVYSLAEAGDGKLYVLTRAGVARYGGDGFERIGRIGGQDPSRVRLLFGDSLGRVWVIIFGPPPSAGYFANGAWTPIDPPPLAPAQVDATVHGASNASATERLFSAGAAVLVRHGADGWTTHRGLLPDARDLTGIEAWQGDFLLVTSKGLCRFVGAAADCDLLPINDGYVRAARPLADSAEAIWVLSDQWLRLYTNVSVEPTITREFAMPDLRALSERDRASLILDDWGNLVVASSGQALLIDLRARQPCCERLQDLIGSPVRTVLEDSYRQLWIGSVDGLHRISTRRFRVYDQRSGLLENEVSAISGFDDGRLVLGHNYGLTVLDGDVVERTIRFPVPDAAALYNSRVLGLDKVGKDVWFAATNFGFGSLAPDGTIERLTVPVASAHSVAATADGGVYLLSAARLDELRPDGAIVKRLDANGEDYFRRVIPIDGLPHVVARSAVYLAQDNGAWARLAAPEGVSVYALANYHGRLHIGTSAGIFELDEDGAWTRHEKVDERAPEVPIYGLAPLDDGLIAGSIDGFYRLGPDRSYVRRSSEHGLPGRETNRDALFDSGADGFLIGTERGLARYRPELDRESTRPPRLRLEEIEVAGQQEPLDEPLVIAHDRNRLAFGFSVVSLSGIDQIVVRTRLAGLEASWSEPQPASIGRVRYLNAPPGNYRFEIQASRDGRLWSDPVSGPPMTIRPPLVRSAPFRLTVATSLLLVAIGLYLWQRRRIRVLNLDSLTLLPNRRAFLAALARATRRGEGNGAVVFLDLNDFKDINDSFGHELGDRVLSALGRRLAKVVGDDGLIARFGGDEFTLLLRGATADGLLKRGGLIERLAATCSQPIDVGDARVQLSAAFGIREYRAGEEPRLESLIRDADTAMYRAKGRGRGEAVVYGDHMRTEAKERLDLENAIRQGIANLEFDCDFQPIVAIDDGRLVGLEALVRWRRHGEVLFPGAFLDSALRSGMIREVGQRVLDRTLRAMRHWEYLSRDEFYVSINASAVELRDARFARDVEAALERYGIAPSRLAIEITEDSLLDRNESVLAQLHRLAELGIQFLVDDFGTGYSSFGYLDDLPVSGLKIDRSFLVDAEVIERKRNIVAAMISLAETLQFKVIAEGVETPAQHELLHALGCPYAQGFHFGRPEPRHAVVARLEAEAKIRAQASL